MSKKHKPQFITPGVRDAMSSAEFNPRPAPHRVARVDPSIRQIQSYTDGVLPVNHRAEQSNG